MLKKKRFQNVFCLIFSFHCAMCAVFNGPICLACIIQIADGLNSVALIHPLLGCPAGT